MPGTDSFLTLVSPSETEVIIKKSRFIGGSYPVTTVDEADSILNEVRTTHKTANHNCFAYSIGLNVPIEKSSDDGEPSGTAGRPILEVLRQKKLNNVLVIVTRYFGGTLLGASGLVRAYTDTTAKAIENNSFVRCFLMSRLHIITDYTQFGKLEHELSQANVAIFDKQFTDAVSLAIYIPAYDVKHWLEQLADWTNGRAHVDVGEPEYVGVKETGDFVFGIYP
ncbi:YigZ family protein [Alicyclobacillus sp. SO9]|uniref:YigZ family protein n=1 Tax=Alicyclobacillus sp. SO9 TaxID=2665646 RepID=UPI0018E76382|nr:YigZ family protein [Alicyclobacillus sp. SO9]QQE78741.1 YigZ family protein [Alicyclobacillus sp. SO9]